VIDFAFYWVAAHRFWNGQNPYLPLTPGDPIMFAPPWILPFLAWLGPFHFHTATSLWFIVSASAFGIAVAWLWEIYGHGEKPLWAIALAGSFTSVILMFILGQIDSLLLFGIAGFLRYETKRPYLAGVFLFFPALKPQIVLLIWVVLLMEAAMVRKWKPLAGFALAFTVVNFAVLALRPSVFGEWWRTLQENRAFFFDTASIGVVLRHVTGFSFAQYVPAMVALAWLLISKVKIPVERHWSWKEQMPVLLAVSLIAAPYSWYQDHVMLLPALFVAGVKLLREPMHILLVVTAYLGLNVAGLSWLIVKGFLGYAWIPLCWLVLYGLIVRMRQPGLALR
jgi:hypothetical protein